MKNLLFILFLVLKGCDSVCTFSQIADKVLYADKNCTAILPDYRSLAIVTGGCTGVTLSQTPRAGTLLTATNKSVTVILKATGTNNKSAQASFVVNMIDTVTPKILVVKDLVDNLLKRTNEIYDIADKMVGQIDNIYEKTFPYDSFPGLKHEDSFKTKLLVIASRDSAGHRQRVIQYVDSLQIPIGK